LDARRRTRAIGLAIDSRRRPRQWTEIEAESRELASPSSLRRQVPTVWRERGFQFFFWSDERNEPPHIHARAGDAYAKVWLGPPIEVAEWHDCNARERRTILEIVTAQRAMMQHAWHEHFGT